MKHFRFRSFSALFYLKKYLNACCFFNTKTSRLIFMLICALGLSANKCYKKSDLENRITVVNKLDKAIYVVPGVNFPDTTLNFTSKEAILANRNSYFVDAKAENRISNLSLCTKSEWERVVSSDTLYLFVFESNTVETIPWDVVRKNYLVLKRVKLSYSELISSDCKILID